MSKLKTENNLYILGMGPRHELWYWILTQGIFWFQKYACEFDDGIYIDVLTMLIVREFELAVFIW